MAKNTRKNIVKIPDAEYNNGRQESKEDTLPKPLAELTLADRFIFYRVMQDKELCRQLLEIILNMEIERIEYSEGEKTIEVRNDAKGIRLDIYVKDEKTTVYNVEMQAAYATNLPQRSRYYQNLIDANLLGRGTDYRELNCSFVIFICLRDVFGEGRHIYTFENRCIEDTRIALGDGAVKIFLNPYSQMDDVTPELRNFLNYLADGIATDKYTERLVEAVETAKKDPRLMVEYMSYYAEQADRRAEREESRAEGIAEGMEKGRLEAIQILIKSDQKHGISREEVKSDLMELYALSSEEAEEKLKLYWSV